MKETERSPAEGRGATAEQTPDFTGLLIPCLFLLLIPNLLQLRAVFGHESAGREEHERRVGAACRVALCCLPAALLCIAWLLTQGASRCSHEGATAAGHSASIGFGRVFLLAVILGALFLIVTVVGLELTLGGPFLGWPTALLLGFWTPLGLSRMLIVFWGFRIATRSAARLVAAAAFAFMAQCWDLSLAVLVLSLSY